jgi:excisionase family DNA binding protein
LRHCHHALHAFATQLRGELDEAVRYAKSRNLGPARHIQQIGDWVLDQFTKRPDATQRLSAPTGISVSPDLALGLRYVDASALAERVDAWSQVVAALACYEDKPFERKPIVIGGRNRRRSTARGDDAEQATLVSLEREARALLAPFHAVTDQFAERLVTTPTKRERKRAGASEMLTVPEAAKRLGIAPEKVRGWIQTGELPASNVAQASSTRPRWRIDEKDLQQFSKSRQPISARPRGDFASTAERSPRRFKKRWAAL